MKKFIFGLTLLLGYSIGVYSMTNSAFLNGTMKIPYAYTPLMLIDEAVQGTITTDTLYEAKTILAQYVYPRADGFASFAQGSCTNYVARQRPDLFLNDDGSRRITGNAEERLVNAKKLGLSTGTTPKQGAIAVYYNGRGGRQYGHVAYVEQVQSNGVIIVSEMNYTEDYIVTVRAIDATLAAGYIY